MGPWAKLNRNKSALAIAVLGVVALAAFSPSRSPAQTTAPVAAPTSAPTEQPGIMMVIRWDVLLNDDGMVPLDQLDRQAVDTTSNVYHAAICDAAALRGAVMNARDVAGMEGAEQNSAVSQSAGQGQMYMNQGLYFYHGGTNQKIRLQGNGEGNEEADLPDADHIHLKIDYTRVRIQLYDPKARKQAPGDKAKPSLTYDGKLAAGQSLMFLGTLHSGATPYYHLIAWEAFKANPQYQTNFDMVRSADTWCAMGPDKIRAASDVATVWAARAQHEYMQVSAKWEQKLEDGKILKLTGITQPTKYPFCWWDADGQPASIKNYVSLGGISDGQRIFASVELTGSAEEWKKQSPSGKPLRNMGERTGPYQTLTLSVNNHQAKCGVPVGDWQKVGEIKAGGSINVDGKTYRLRPPQAQGDNQFYVDFAPATREDNGDEVMLTVVGEDGTELEPSYLNGFVSEGYGMGGNSYEGMSLAKVKSYNVWKRKRQWVTFQDFAMEPATPPPAKADPAELAKLLATANERQMQAQTESAQEQLAATAEKRKEWDAIPADPSTPKGALRAMMKAAADGDTKGVRDMIKASQPDPGPTLDAVARFLSANQHAWTLAVARFGEPAVMAIVPSNNPMMHLMDMSAELAGENWQPRPDGGLHSREMDLSKGDDGKFYLDMSTMVDEAKKQPESMQFIAPMTERAETWSKALTDNPKITLEEFKAMMTR